MTTSLEELVKKTTDTLTHRGLKLATAESCTGGGLGFWLTTLPGSSTWFERGWITYSNEAKCELLGVNPLTLESFGAVSEQVAREMAEGALDNSKADLSIAITGLAGPDGGSEKKPVGLVWIAITQRDFGTTVTKNLLSGSRADIRNQAISKSLANLLEILTTKAEKIPTI